MPDITKLNPEDKSRHKELAIRYMHLEQEMQVVLQEIERIESKVK